MNKETWYVVSITEGEEKILEEHDDKDKADQRVEQFYDFDEIPDDYSRKKPFFYVKKK